MAVTADWRIRLRQGGARAGGRVRRRLAVRLPAEYLRVESPSAEVQGHGPSQRQIVPGRRHVGIMAIEPVGNYAVRLVFDDLHDTGIYSWDYLHELGREQDRAGKVSGCARVARGLSREPG